MAKSNKKVVTTSKKKKATPPSTSVGNRTKKASTKKTAKTSQKKRVLGRGLSALMSSSATEAPVEVSPAPVVVVKEPPITPPSVEENVPEQSGLLSVEIDRLEPNPSQPRKYFNDDEIRSLSESIKNQGLLQPILVRPCERPTADFEIVAGERRYRACQLAGISTVPVIVRELNNREILEIGIVENIQREDLNPVEEALAYRALITEFDLNQEQVAVAVGKKRSTIANTLRLLQLDERIQSALVKGEISVGHAKALLSLESFDEQSRALELIQKKDLSVRALEQLIAHREKPDLGNEQVPTIHNEEVEARFRQALGTKVIVKTRKEGRGEVRISFFSEHELTRILEQVEMNDNFGLTSADITD